MQSTVESKLVSYNNLALAYQDEVFTLAFYLLGDERGATEAVQKAFESAFRKSRRQGPDGFRFAVLRDVLASSRQGKKLWAGRGQPEDELGRRLAVVPREAREAAVLVDVLGLRYEEAGQVLGCSHKQISRLVAQARLHLSRDAEKAQ